MVIITPQIKDLVLADILSAEEPSFIFNYQDSKNEYLLIYKITNNNDL